MAAEIALIALIAALASALTFFSGFGLGTILLPAFAIFLPVPVAVAATAVVHLANNLFKGGLLWRGADWPTVCRFGLPSIPAAVLGAWLLAMLGSTERLFEWRLFGNSAGPTGAGLAVGALLIALAVIELQPWFARLQAPPRWMPLGGVLTGFLGGLTGQQGALRSIFLLRSGLAPPQFIATGAMIAILVDLARIGTYWAALSDVSLDPAGREGGLVLAGTSAAFLGAWLGAQYVRKVTIGAVRTVVATLMIAIGLAMALGLIG